MSVSVFTVSAEVRPLWEQIGRGESQDCRIAQASTLGRGAVRTLVDIIRLDTFFVTVPDSARLRFAEYRIGLPISLPSLPR